MLHESTVSVNLLNVLKRLQDKSVELGFALAGGTSLALRLGHRASLDLDFITDVEFDSLECANAMAIGSENITGIATGTLQCVVHNIKVEFLRHAYPRLREDDLVAGVRMWSLEDVGAMKLNAITNRGSKKDFYDIAALLDCFSLEEILHFYRLKYSPGSLLKAIRSLAWFEDAECEPDPVSLNGMDWSSVKELVGRAIRRLR